MWMPQAQILRDGKVDSEPESLIARFNRSASPLSGSDWRRFRCAMAVRGHARGGTCGRSVGDAARAGRFQDDVGEDGSPRRSRNCPTDAARLIPAGALQVDRSTSRVPVRSGRKLLQSKLLDVEISRRGVLRDFGSTVGKTPDRIFARRAHVPATARRRHCRPVLLARPARQGTAHHLALHGDIAARASRRPARRIVRLGASGGMSCASAEWPRAVQAHRARAPRAGTACPSGSRMSGTRATGDVDRRIAFSRRPAA